MTRNNDALSASDSPRKGPNCWDCRHLSITWDVRMPYGCKLMGFRSKVIPSMEVLRTDGRFCGGFSSKPVKSDSAPKNSPTKPNVEHSSTSQETDHRAPLFTVNLII